MQQNVGELDQVLRITLGFALLFAGFILDGPARYAAFAGFAILAITGFVGKCPLYRMFGVRTSRKT